MTANGCIVHCGGDGPLLVRSPLRVRIAEAEDGIEKPKAALCRCGKSANKPFCDGAHRDIEFRASGPIDTTRAVPGSEATSGSEAEEIVVTAHANGPLHFDGVVELSGEGHDGSAHFRQPWMCRCGASKNKPFCDGSHKEIEFQAEGL